MHPLAERILRKEATSFYECYTSSASLLAYYSNDIFMPYLDGLSDITNRIAEEGKMAGALASEKNFQLVKVPTVRLMKIFLRCCSDSLRHSCRLDPLN